MSAFGFSLPGTTSYYNQRRGQKKDKRPRRPGGSARLDYTAPPDKFRGLLTTDSWLSDPAPQFTDDPFGGRFGADVVWRDPSTIPKYAETYFDDPERMWEFNRQFPGFLGGLEKDWGQQQRDQANWAARKTSAETGAAAAEEEFGAGKASALERYEGFAPQFAEMSANWERFAAPDYKAVSDYAIQPALAEATRGGALYSQTARNQMAARGLGRSGLSASLQGAGAGMAARGRGMIRGGQATANEQMRRQAAQQLMTSRGLEAELGELIGRTEMLQNPQALAWEALQADILNQRTSPDPYAFPSLMHGLEKEERHFGLLEDEMASLDRALAEAQQFGWRDILDFISSLGLPEIIGRKYA